MRLIDAVELVRDIDIAFKGIKASDKEFERFCDLCGLIWMQPIVDPVKHGRWIYYEDETIEDGGRCSVCGGEMPAKWSDHAWGYVETDYCPNCGAYMMGGDEE